MGRIVGFGSIEVGRCGLSQSTQVEPGAWWLQGAYKRSPQKADGRHLVTRFSRSFNDSFVEVQNQTYSYIASTYYTAYGTFAQGAHIKFEFPRKCAENLYHSTLAQAQVCNRGLKRSWQLLLTERVQTVNCECTFIFRPFSSTPDTPHFNVGEYFAHIPLRTNRWNEFRQLRTNFSQFLNGGAGG